MMQPVSPKHAHALILLMMWPSGTSGEALRCASKDYTSNTDMKYQLPTNMTKIVSGPTKNETLSGPYTVTCVFVSGECTRGIYFTACDQNSSTQVYMYKNHAPIFPNDESKTSATNTDGFTMRWPISPYAPGTYDCFSYDNVTNIMNITRRTQVTPMGITYASKHPTNQSVYNVSCSFNSTFPGTVTLIVQGAVNATVIHNETVKLCGQDLYWNYLVLTFGGTPTFQCTNKATNCLLSGYSRLWSNTTRTPGPPIPILHNCSNYSHPWWTTTARPVTTTSMSTTQLTSLPTSASTSFTYNVSLVVYEAQYASRELHGLWILVVLIIRAAVACWLRLPQAVVQMFRKCVASLQRKHNVYTNV
ncbi:hypothetical protein [Cynomolgus macaque cytomegalovirus strain Mauritius]|uniref:Rh174 n=1 Tax=Cynomolgus macaque cytomegalovirus strain Mauritius TaxID=1690255 RepID=A0A0K1GZQ1_9BETA|nr:hypothetical protein [Cynomolgus macaque cytomegalovirus strain Mauritius]AXG21903.1 hypothetical protein [synthetic construct]AXG22172.1 hypothetical protein [synthetic construct]